MVGAGSIIRRRRIRVTGVVQGVGFRPFVYRLATRLQLSGEVHNDSRGVLIDVEGSMQALDGFAKALLSELPEVARIDNLQVDEAHPQGRSGFFIAQSVADVKGAVAMVPADIGICGDCLRELADPADRRFGYAFLNCTNCGPRYSIIHDVPYDRDLTTMRDFRMCEACRAEYQNPLDRRFHAEPNACRDCGPRLTLQVGEETYADRPLERAQAMLAEGKILALKGIGGFHLACDATNEAAVRTLRERKRRSGKPFALMVRDVADISALCNMTTSEQALLMHSRRPIVLMERRSDADFLATAIAPGNGRLGLMLPYTPLHYLLFGADVSIPPRFQALVMTSGNLSEEPIVAKNEEALEKLSPIVDGFLMNNRDIAARVDDSVLFTFRGHAVPIRRSRGFAPLSINMGRDMKQVLAVGGHLKNTFCLTQGPKAILSQHIGDLENLETMELFEETLQHMKRFFRIEPTLVAHDLHPGYMSTRFAERSGLPCIGVQHHHAHIASCMAEHRLDGDVIGIALDGTGYGVDGQIWGGEVLRCSRRDFDRYLHLRYIPLAGGDTAVREIWRPGLAYLLDAFGTTDRLLDLGIFESVPTTRVEIVHTMLARQLNTIQTSSCGRLFDAVAAICGLRSEATFEGQAAMELEARADPSETGRYGFDIALNEIDLRQAVLEIVRDMRLDRPVSGIAARFHNTLIAAFTDAARKLSQHSSLQRVCLSGGSFQNLWLLNGVSGSLEKAGFSVYTQRQVPSNDGGLSLGQAAVADAAG